MNHLLSVINISRSYLSKTGTIVANQNVNFRLSKGEIVGLLGENGSGKSTLIRQIAGLCVPDSGKIEHGIPSRNQVGMGYMSQQRTTAFDHLTPLEYLSVVAAIKGVEKTLAKPQISYLLDHFNFQYRQMLQIRTLSGGYHQLLDFCAAVLGFPALLVLDEPLNNLDIGHKKRVVSYLSEGQSDWRPGIILVSHNLTEIESLVNRVLIMKDGKIIVDNTVSKIKSELDNFIYFDIQNISNSQKKIWRQFALENNGGCTFSDSGIHLKLAHDKCQALWQKLSFLSQNEFEKADIVVKTGRLENAYSTLLQVN